MSSRSQRLQIAQTTLDALKNGSFTTAVIEDSQALPVAYKLPIVKNTKLYQPSDLSNWRSSSPMIVCDAPEVSVLQISTLQAAALLSQMLKDLDSESKGVGVLNFASATKPGGGFLSGAQAQEETIARSSTLYPSLISDTASGFYATHKRDNRGCYYTHSIIWSPDVLVFRNDRGDWHNPYLINVVTSPAVNAGIIRQRAVNAAQEEIRIEVVMKERMSRILHVFESHGVRNLVLGSFGTGVFKNSVSMVARLWGELLGPQGPFSRSFERIMFGIIDTRTCAEFKRIFEQVTGE